MESNEVIVKVVKARKLQPRGNFVLSIPVEIERILLVGEDTKFLVSFSKERATISYERVNRRA